jgi:hypothetical protein
MRTTVISKKKKTTTTTIFQTTIPRVPLKVVTGKPRDKDVVVLEKSDAKDNESF